MATRAPRKNWSYKSEAIEFNGIIFRRYPKSKRWADAMYFRPHAMHIKNGVEALHREIWKSVNGPIPEGYHIHHKDGNPLNNDISNLDCMPGPEHMSKHGPDTKSEEHRDQLRRRLEDARQDGKNHEWLRTDAGRAKMRQNAVEQWENKPLTTKICEMCGKEYQTPFPTRSKYCSPACETKKRNTTVYLEERICPQCGKPFTVARHSRQIRCSRECYADYARGRAKPRVRSNRG